MTVGNQTPSTPTSAQVVPSALCVAWAPQAWPRDAKLERELTRPGLALRYARDDFEAVALLCRDFAEHGPKASRALILLLVEPSQLQGLGDALSALEARLPVLHLWLFDASKSPVLRGVTMFELREQSRRSHTREPAMPAPTPLGVATSWVGPVVSAGSQRWTSMALSHDGSNESNDSGGAHGANGASSPQVPAMMPTPGRAHIGGPALKLTQHDTPRDAQHDSASRAEPESERSPENNQPILTDDELAMLLGDDEPRSKGRTAE